MKFKSVFIKVLIIVVTCMLSVCFSVGCNVSCGNGNDSPSGETTLPNPPSGSEGEDEGEDENNSNGGGNQENKWDISAEPVTAELIESGSGYKLVVTGSGNMKNFKTKQDTPWYQSSDKINAIELGNGITGIGANAFADITVESILIPQGVKTVENYGLPKNADIFAYSETKITEEQNSDINVYIYSQNVPETCDRHWTSWGNTNDITAEPFEKDANFWHLNSDGIIEKWNKRKVLFIGNSFTFYYQIPVEFSAIARDLGCYVETYSIAVPGRTLLEHSKSTNQIDLLFEKVKDFDYIVLQEQSTRPYEDYQKFVEGINGIKAKVDNTQSKAKIYLYETWGSPASAGGDSVDKIAEMEEKLYQAYSQAGSDLNLNVTYVGRAFTKVKQDTNINLYFGDNRHPGPAGSYLSACVHIASMLGSDVRKTTLSGKDLIVISNEGGQPQAMNLSEQDCEILRAAAYDTVFSENEKQTYTVNFWYKGEINSSKTVTEGMGFNLPSLQVAEGEKFSGWKIEDGQITYAADYRISYSAISNKINNGVINIYAQTHEMIIAVWGRFITEDNYKKIMQGFEIYCNENGIAFNKTTFIYYEGKTQNVDPYFLIANFTQKALEDGADMIFACGDNIKSSADSKVSALVKEFKALGVSIQGNSTRYVARLSDTALAQAFYEFATTEAAKEIYKEMA